MKILIGIITIASFIFYSKRENKKELESITFADTIPCQEITIKCTQSRDGNYVIRTEAEYHSMLQIRSMHPDCGSYSLPEIDFDRYTLIGSKHGMAGCEKPKLIYNLIKRDEYLYEMKIIMTQNGNCKLGFSSQFWCLIPKINQQAKIEFNILLN